MEYTTADYLLQAVDEDTAGTDGDDESEEDEKGKDKRTETKEVSTNGLLVGREKIRLVKK